MTEPNDDPIAQLIRELDAASVTLARLAPLSRAEGERIGASYDRLASQIAKISRSGRDVKRTN